LLKTISRDAGRTPRKRHKNPVPGLRGKTTAQRLSDRASEGALA
jgi:hypothetical protein